MNRSITVESPLPGGAAFGNGAENRHAADEARAERAASKNLVDNIFYSVPDALVVIEQDMTIGFVNQATLDLTGFDEDDLIGRPIGFLSKNNRFSGRLFGKLLKGKRVLGGIETKCLRKDGRSFPISLSISKVYDPQRGTHRFICIAQDITRRKRLEAESRTIVEIINGVCTTSNLYELLQIVHRSIGRVVSAENCFVALFDAASEMLHLQFIVDKHDTAPPAVKLGRGMTAYVFRQKQPMLLTTDRIGELRRAGEIDLIGTPPAVWLGVPLIAKGEVIGVLVVQHYENENAYEQRDLEFLTAVGDQIAIAIERKRFEDALRISEEQHRLLFETNPQPAYVYDLETLKFLAVNEAAVRHYGYTREEFLGEITIKDIRPAEDVPKFLERVARVRDDRDTVLAPSRHRKKDGSVRDVEITSHVLSFGGRRSEIVLVNDVTERRRMEEIQRENEERFRDLFDYAPIAYHELDAEGRFTRINKTEEKMLGYTNEELKGRSPAEIIVEDVSREAIAEKLAGTRSLEPVERTFIRKDRSHIPVLCTDRLIYDKEGRIAGLRSTLQDITARKQAEEQIRRFNEKLQQSNRELQDFAYVASHDLQEPLRKVQAFADRLSSKYAHALEGSGLDYLERMRNAAERMQKLIQDLLTFSRVATKAQPFEPVDLDVVAREVLSDLEVAIEQSGATVELENLPVIDADPLQMRQLIQNLVGNALKFRRPETAPLIEISGAVENNECRLTVRDNGIGFDEKYLDRIFTVFQRLHGRTEYEGSGVGLAVCRKIAERHHGGITAESAPGEGAAFIVTLPHRQINTDEVNQ